MQCFWDKKLNTSTKNVQPVFKPVFLVSELLFYIRFTIFSPQEKKILNKINTYIFDCIFRSVRFFITFGEKDLSRVPKHPLFQKFKTCSAVHLSLDIFQSIYLPLNLTVAPF